jgi:hypothetical protein
MIYNSIGTGEGFDRVRVAVPFEEVFIRPKSIL